MGVLAKGRAGGGCDGIVRVGIGCDGMVRVGIGFDDMSAAAAGYTYGLGRGSLRTDITRSLMVGDSIKLVSTRLISKSDTV